MPAETERPGTVPDSVLLKWLLKRGVVSSVVHANAEGRARAAFGHAGGFDSTREAAEAWYWSENR